MAFLKKVIDKATFLLIIGIWSLASSYILNSTVVPAEAKTLIVGIGTLVIAWLGLETGNTNGNSTPVPTQPAPTIEAETAAKTVTGVN